jgi:hypothetical protein
VRVTSRKERDLRQYDTFDWHQTSPTKRYFVGGFNKSVSIKYLTNFVTSRGATVTMIRKFPMRKSRNKVIVRLNVEANENADLVLDPGFWPKGITCETWMSRAEIQQKNLYGNEALTHRSRRHQDMVIGAKPITIDWPPFSDFNKYSTLTPDEDL